MGVRESMNDSPRAVAIGMALVVVALAVITWSQLRTPRPSSDPGLAYFTVDEGKTSFVDAADKRTPFTHDGKEAVRAITFACDAAQKDRFVGYLERSDPAASAGKGTPGGPDLSIQVRRPGEAKWVARFSPEGSKILSVRCPNGASMEPRQVAP